MEIKSYGEIKYGKFIPKMPEVYYQQLRDVGNIEHCLLTIVGGSKRTGDQNAYAFAMCNAIASRLNMDGWDFSAYEVYKKIENDRCKTDKMNETTGQVIEVVRPLKEYDRSEFFEVIEQARQFYNEKLDIHIQTPAEFYGLTEDAYELWRHGAVTFTEAKKMSNETP